MPSDTDLKRAQDNYTARFKKTCTITRQTTDITSGIRKGPYHDIQTSVPCKITVKPPQDSPFGTAFQGGNVGRVADRLIELPVQINGVAVDVQIGDRLVQGTTTYAVQDLATDDDIPLSILINGELVPPNA